MFYPLKVTRSYIYKHKIYSMKIGTHTCKQTHSQNYAVCCAPPFSSTESCTFTFSLKNNEEVITNLIRPSLAMCKFPKQNPWPTADNH